MKAYSLTVYAKDGEKLLDETFEAANDSDAKEIGLAKLQEGGFEEHTHRCTSSTGKLVLFHS